MSKPATSSAGNEARISADDPAARSEIAYVEHAGWLRSVLGRRFGSELAAELIQEAFAKAVAVDAGSFWRDPRQWLLRVAMNAALEQRRRAAVRAPDALAGTGGPEESRLPCPPEQDEALLLKQVIAGLPPKLRDAFVLHRFETLTYPEIAQRLNISTKTVEWRISRAMEICAARLRD